MCVRGYFTMTRTIIFLVLISTQQLTRAFRIRRSSSASIVEECNDPRITNRTQCLEIMSQPLLVNSYHVFQTLLQPDAFLENEEQKNKRKCPNAEEISQIAEQGFFSLSPYVMTCSSVQNRIPKIVCQVQCLCTYCIDPKTGRASANAGRSLGLTSLVNVYHDVTVNEEKQLIVTQEAFTAGCTCVLEHINNK